MRSTIKAHQVKKQTNDWKELNSNKKVMRKMRKQKRTQWREA